MLGVGKYRQVESTIPSIKAVANQWMFDSGIVIASVHDHVSITFFNSRVNEFSSTSRGSFNKFFVRA